MIETSIRVNPNISDVKSLCLNNNINYKYVCPMFKISMNAAPNITVRTCVRMLMASTSASAVMVIN